MKITLDFDVTQQQIDDLIKEFIDVIHDEFPDFPLVPQQITDRPKLFTFMMEKWIQSYYGDQDYIQYWELGMPFIVKELSK